MRARIFGVAVVLAAGVALAGPQEPAPKSPVSCDKIVETYKAGKSVDETASALMVDQSRVVECLKAAGVSVPDEADE